MLKRRNIGINLEINFTYLNLGFLLLFLCNQERMSWLGNVDDYALLADREHGDPGIQYPVTKHGSSYPQIVY